MPAKRRQPPAYAPRGGQALALPQWHIDALLIAYRIATYQPRTREAWRSALESSGLEGDARRVASEYLNDRWKAEPYEAL